MAWAEGLGVEHREKARLPLGSTTPPQAMPEELRGDDVVAAYRRYYCAEKQGYWVGERWVASKWTRRGVPWFMLD
jgi:formylmethanofuran dehydrogenase subunit A